MIQFKRCITLIIAGLIFNVQLALAGETDLFIQKLVEKGILTPTEARILVDETQAEVAKQNSKGLNTALPQWVQAIQLKGDARVRYQFEKRNSDSTSRNRGRIRYRLGLVSRVNDQWEAGAGLASGEAQSSNTLGNDPRSTNASFLNTFERPEIRLDYAYGRYKPTKNLDLVFGKFQFPNYLWTPTDLLWDSDINPAGASFSYRMPNAIGQLDAFVNGGAWVMEEYRTTSSIFGQWMQYAQVGLSGSSGKFDGKIATTYYNFNRVKNHALDWSAGSNSKLNGNYIYDYDSIGGSAEFGVNNLFGGLPFHIDERIALLGDYISNISSGVATPKDGWMIGVQVGNAKVSDKKTWNAKYLYGRLGKDAWLDTFPDSDRYKGATNAKGHEVMFNYALAKNVTLGLDWYQTDALKGSHDREQILQVDLNLKF